MRNSHNLGCLPAQRVGKCINSDCEKEIKLSTTAEPIQLFYKHRSEAKQILEHFLRTARGDHL